MPKFMQILWLNSGMTVMTDPNRESQAAWDARMRLSN